MSPVQDLISSHDTIKTIGDIAAASISLATLLSWLPGITAVMAFLWWTIRIYETKTVQKLLGRSAE